MKKKVPALTPSRREGFEHQLRAYSTLGSAALATTAALAGATAASAGIWTTTMTPSLTLSGANDTPPDVTFSFGPAGFKFHGSRTVNTAGPTFINGRLSVAGYQAAIAAGDGTLRNVAAGVGINATGLGGPFAFGGGGFAFRTHANNASAPYGYFPFGNFVPTQFLGGSQLTHTGYIGFKRVQEGHTYYGWLHVTVSGADGRPTSIAMTPGPNTGGVTGAYIDSINGTIAAGQVSPIPEPASVATGLALFALGAAGVREHRRRKREGGAR